MNSSHNFITVGARASPLSRAQVNEVLQELRKFHPHLHFLPLWTETIGDKDLKTSLRELNKTDFFTREVDLLQLEGKCRIAIHSAKDLPEPLKEGLVLAALTQGVDPSDVLVLREGETLETLPQGARIGTSCKRREETIRQLRHDLCCADIRGPIEVRLSKLDKKEIDGVVMAEAALIRLNLTHRSRIRLCGETAPLQGQLAIVARSEDEEMLALFSCLDTRKKVLYLGSDPSQFKTWGKVIHYPVINILPRPFDTPHMQAVFDEMADYTHLLFTSKHAVQVFCSFLEEKGYDLLKLREKFLIAIGPTTAAHLLERKLDPDLIAEETTQEGLIRALSLRDWDEAYFLFPRSSQSRGALLHFFTERGIRHQVCDLYDTVPQKLTPVPPLNSVDEIVFTSPSTVSAFLHIYGSIPQDKQLIALGPITQEALQKNQRKIGHRMYSLKR